jgi:4'-phosphopantetheinyl transferase
MAPEGAGGLMDECNFFPYAPLVSLDTQHLGPAEIHLWLVPLDASPDTAASLEALLAPDEKTRAARFRFPEHRLSFIVARGMLRVLLGFYLGRAAADVEFSYTDFGKPRLLGNSDIRFNVSHSGSFALYAMTRYGELGVDVEQHRVMDDLESIAERFFTPGELSDLLNVPLDGRTAAFFRCWTRKEAFVKAVGEGLSIPLDSFRVSIDSGEACLLHAPPSESERWSLYDVTPMNGYAAALMAERPVSGLKGIRITDLAASLPLFAEWLPEFR